MKKLLVVLAVIFLLFFGGVYLFIPRLIPIHTSTVIEAPANGVLRYVLNERSWGQWWPGQTIGTSSPFLAAYKFGDNNYLISDKKISSFILKINNREDTAFTAMNFINERPDSLQIYWDAVIPGSLNPFKRIGSYFHARNLEKDMQHLLDTLTSFYQSEENMYNMHINREALMDSFLVFTDTRSDSFPTTEKIYGLVDQLRLHIRNNKGIEKNNPMMNWSKESDSSYIIRVAIPTDRPLPAAGKIVPKLMPPRVRILTADIRGGQLSADQGMNRMDDFARDHFYKAPGMPFFSLTTDRRTVSDSTKWITRIYYPIM